jgi:hypothetical protein
MKQVASQAIGIGMASVSNPAHDPRADDLEPDASLGEFSLHPAHPATETSNILFGKQATGREDPIAQETYALLAREDHALVRMDLEPQGLQELLDLLFDLVELSFVIGENQKVINIPNVTQPKPVGDEVVEGIEIDIGKELTGLIAQWQTPTALDRCEKVVAREPHESDHDN